MPLNILKNKVKLEKKPVKIVKSFKKSLKKTFVYTQKLWKRLIFYIVKFWKNILLLLKDMPLWMFQLIATTNVFDTFIFFS